MSLKVLFIILADDLDSYFTPNIVILKKYIDDLSKKYTVDVSCVLSHDNFQVYQPILPFKYTMINPKSQFDKLCDFISLCDEKYDWYVKIRPEIELLDQLNFENYCKQSINVRARRYIGPQKLLYATSVGGEGGFKYCGSENGFDTVVKKIIADDQIFIFHRNVIDTGGFLQLHPLEIYAANNDGISKSATDDAIKYRTEKTIVDAIEKAQLNTISNIQLMNAKNVGLHTIDYRLSFEDYKNIHQREWFHTSIWNSRNININIVGINVIFHRSPSYIWEGPGIFFAKSGNLNMENV